MKNCSDDELLYLMRSGNQDATECFYSKYYIEVSKWIRKYLRTSYLSYDFEDCLQESMMNFNSILDSYREDKNASIKTFMKNAICKRIINYTKQGKDKKIFQEYTVISLDDYSGNTDSYKYEELVEDKSHKYNPREPMIITEELASYNLQVNKVASQLEKDVMELVGRGYCVKEISEMKNISPKSIYNAIYRYQRKMNH